MVRPHSSATSSKRKGNETGAGADVDVDDDCCSLLLLLLLLPFALPQMAPRFLLLALAILALAAITGTIRTAQSSHAWITSSKRVRTCV